MLSQLIAIDLRTTLLFIAMQYIAMPIVTWMVLAKQRTQFVRLWCLGGLCLGMGLFLFAFQGTVSDWAAPSGVYLLVLISTFTFIRAFQVDMGRPSRLWPMVVCVVLLMAIFEVLHRVLHTPVLRAQFVAVSLAALLLKVAHLAWCASRLEHSSSARWIAGTFFLMALLLLVRLSQLSLQPPLNPMLVQQNATPLVTAVLLMFSAVISHLAFMGIALERAKKRELAMVEERSRAEERHTLSKQIAHLDRQRSLGELSASLGHEISQPLATILTNAQTVKRGLETGYFSQVQVQELLDKIAHSTRRASQIVDRIRGFIKPSALQSAPVNLVDVIEDAMALIADEARRQQVTIHYTFDQQRFMVAGDSIQLSQVLLNVLRNAIEALNTVIRRELTIRCQQEGAEVVLRVRDTGVGLSAEALAGVGAPFFTTKENGLGMGIAISHSIAAQHGGTLTLCNLPPAEGPGAQVELRLPSLIAPTLDDHGNEQANHYSR